MFCFLTIEVGILIAKEEARKKMGRKMFVGTYYEAVNVLYKIQELKSQGYAEDEIYAVTYRQDNVSMLKGKTGGEISGTGAEEWPDRFKVLISGEEPIQHAFKEIGLTDEEAEKHYEDVKNAGGVAIFVDEKPIEMDSQAEVDRNGHPLSNQDADGEDSIPRTNTKNL